MLGTDWPHSAAIGLTTALHAARGSVRSRDASTGTLHSPERRRIDAAPPLRLTPSSRISAPSRPNSGSKAALPPISDLRPTQFLRGPSTRQGVSPMPPPWHAIVSGLPRSCHRCVIGCTGLCALLAPLPL